MINKIYVYAPGDPSVGIFPGSWEIHGEMDVGDNEEREAVRAIIADAFNNILGEPCGVRFGDEIPED